MVRRPDHPLLGAFFLSGAAALGYELLWTRLLTLGLGAEMLGVLGVEAGFFAGLAAGALLLHGRARRSPRPARLYALLELGAAGFALVSPWALHALAAWLPGVLGGAVGDNDSALSLAACLAVATLLLLPGTVCLGGTLPALVEARRRGHPDEEARGIGRLYGANTAGAVAGVLVTVYLLMPRLGLAWSAPVLAGLGVGSAALAWWWERGAREPPAPSDPQEPLPLPRWALYAIVGGSGLAGIGLQVVGVRVLGQALENTVYTFANVLVVYLLGTALGAGLYARVAGRLGGRERQVCAWLLLALLASVYIAGHALRAVPSGIVGALVREEGTPLAVHLLAELLAGAAVFLLPATLMGALYSHVVALLAPRGVGRPAALNTALAAAAPFLFGLWAIPRLGYGDALLMAACVFLGLLTMVCVVPERSPAALAVGVAVVIAGELAAPPSLVTVEPEPGWTVLERREGLFGTVQVSEHHQGDVVMRRLRLNQRFRMGGRRAFAERRMGHMPLLLRPDAREAVFLGVGTGATLGAARSHPLRRIVAVEIVPEIVAVLPRFNRINNHVLQEDRLALHVADARRYVAVCPARPDLVVADLIHPAREGASNLLSVEHFENVRRCLRADGAFAQWLPLHQLDPDNLRTVLRTFLSVFPRAHAFLGLYNAQMPILMVIGGGPRDAAASRVDPARVARRLRSHPAAGRDRPGEFVQDVRDLLGAYLLDRAAMERIAGPGPLNTDLEPRVLFDAPRSAYENRAALAYHSLSVLLSRRRPYPESLVAGVDGPRRRELRAAVDRRTRAVDHYLRGEIERARTGLAAPDRAVELLLASYRTDPGFAPARGLLLGLTRRAPARAGHILEEMLARTPAEPRVYQAYFQHLRRAGDQAGIARLLQRATRNGVRARRR